MIMYDENDSSECKTIMMKINMYHDFEFSIQSLAYFTNNLALDRVLMFSFSIIQYLLFITIKDSG